MKNTSECDGLSREKQRERSSTPISLKVLEDDFPALLSRVLGRMGDFASYYRYQPLVVLSEIENFNAASAEDIFHRLNEKEQKKAYVSGLVKRLDDWKTRLEYACIEGGSLALLRDIGGLSVDPALPHRRMLARFLSSIRMLQSNGDAYREEIYSLGTMDPSLAVIVATLTNYREIAGQFNRRWCDLPYIYMNDMLGLCLRPARGGCVWLSFDKNPLVDDGLLPQGMFHPSVDPSVVSGYRLLSESLITSTALESVEMIVLERNADRCPESTLEYVTSISRIDIPGNIHTPVAVGVRLQSGVLLLRGGERSVFITFKLIESSFEYFKELIDNVLSDYVDDGRTISRTEAIYKILSDSFVLEATLGGEWRQVDDFRLSLKENERSFVFCFHLNNELPALEPLDGDELPSVRLFINNTAWLYPYSWARRLFAESVHIKVKVDGLRDIRLYNALGPIDPGQPFVPFGLQAAKDSWFAFGSDEMAYKRVTRSELSFGWQQLPNNAGGLAEHYRGYEEKGVEPITNRSFRVRVEHLHNHEWKRVSDDPHYLFQTGRMENAMPDPDEALTDRCTIAFDVSDARQGYYRLVLVSPDMGFGAEHYRRLFAETVMHNGRSRKKRPVPSAPIAPLICTPRLNYVAGEACYFGVGQPCPITITYIDPLSMGAAVRPDTTRPVALLRGPEDEGNLIITLSGAVGQSFFRLYVDVELLSRKAGCDELPDLSWYYSSGGWWTQLRPERVLRDDTCCLTRDGVVELQLPDPVGEDMLDNDGLFRICASLRCFPPGRVVVKNIYTNVGEAVVAEASAEEAANPLIVAARQITPVQGAVPAETGIDLKTRFAGRSSHRNRALLPADYEQLVLHEFPEIVKVKCFAGIDAAAQDRRGAVTLALLSHSPCRRLPLCEDFLLCRVKERLQQRASPFVTLDVVNPVYEEVTIFCGVSVSPEYPVGTAISDIRRCINDCIAPWYDRGEVPAFGYSFSMRDLLGRIRGSKYVDRLHGIKFAYPTMDIDNRLYYLNKDMPDEIEQVVIAPSNPWGILVPSSQQHVIICTEKEWRNKIEFGDLEVGRTFIIG